MPIQKGQKIDVEARLKATRKNNAWVNMEYTSPKGVVKEFNLRPKQFEQLMNKERGYYETLAESAYSMWIGSTKAGHDYSGRRHVEGVLKTAQSRGDTQLVQDVQDILQKSDKEVAEFWDDWYDSMSAMEIEEFFEYDPK